MNELYINLLKINHQVISYDVLDNMLDPDFIYFFNGLIDKIIKNIKKKTYFNHTHECIKICTYDLVLKYLFDFEYFKVPEHDCHDFFRLQYHIFRDNKFRILEL
jgi:hypothetical protein